MNEIIKLEDIQISINNPRFNVIDNINFDFIDSLIKGNENYSEYDEYREMIKLFSLDFSSFKELINSIIDMGFRLYGEKIYLIKGNNNKYIVVEGNRRISCLKLLNNFNKIKEFYKKTNVLSKNEQVINELNRIESKIENINIKNELLKNEYEIFQDNNSIYTFIMQKHISGNPKGYLKWKTGKYYFDLLKIFENLNILHFDDLKQADNEFLISQKMNKVLSKIWKDYQNALYINQIIKIANPEWNEEQVFYFMSNNKISALEISFTKKLIEKLLDKKIKNVSEIFKPTLIEKEKKYINKINGYDNFEKFCLFFWEAYHKKILTTRNELNEEKYNIAIELFNDNIDIKPDENIAIYSLDTLNRAELNYLYKKSDNPKLKEIAKNKLNLIFKIENIIKQISLLSSDESISKYNFVLKHLLEQLKWNMHKQVYLNAIAVTIRSISEYLTKILLIGNALLFENNAISIYKILINKNINDTEFNRNIANKELVKEFFKPSSNNLNVNSILKNDELIRYINESNDDNNDLNKIGNMIKEWRGANNALTNSYIHSSYRPELISKDEILDLYNDFIIEYLKKINAFYPILNSIEFKSLAKITKKIFDFAKMNNIFNEYLDKREFE